MKHNMGNIDRIVRVLIAVAIAVLYFTNTITGTLGYVLLAVGGIFLLTSLVSSCPLYSIFGINTCPVKKANQ
jgi:Na+/phosphate symporter